MASEATDARNATPGLLESVSFFPSHFVEDTNGENQSRALGATCACYRCI